MKALKAFIKPFDAPQANQLTDFYMTATLAFHGLIHPCSGMCDNAHQTVGLDSDLANRQLHQNL